MSGNKTTLLTDWLRALEVPCTAEYCDGRFRAMPFHTLFGLGKTLEEFGVASRAFRFDDKAASLGSLPLPCVAVAAGQTVVLTGVTPERVSYITAGRQLSIARDAFVRDWSGVAMVAYPSDGAREPGYILHRNIGMAASAKRYVLAVAALVVFLYFFVACGLWSGWPTVALTIVDLAGLYMSWLLVRHQLGFVDKAATRVCGVLQAGGCNTVLGTAASKFFGLFGWSEVGLSYFSVTLATMLLFPQHLPWLALVNLCCLPFTVWSLWYQHFRAKAWCTMCVSVQALLWLQFVCYLAGGFSRFIFPLDPAIIILGAVYVAALLGLNALMPLAAPTKNNS